MEENKQELAREFISLILPRMLGQFTETLQFFIESSKQVESSKLNKESQKKAFESLKQKEEELKKVLSQDFYDKLSEKLVPLFCDSLTEDELRSAINHERLTIKISSIAENMEVLFKEVLGEGKQ